MLTGIGRTLAELMDLPVSIYVEGPFKRPGAIVLDPLKRASPIPHRCAIDIHKVVYDLPGTLSTDCDIGARWPNAPSRHPAGGTAI